MNKSIIHILIFFCWTSICTAQDFHFSQINYAPVNLNPGHAGHFDGRYRIHLNARDQWRAVTSPYKTYGFSLDMDSIGHLPIAPMIGIFSDKAGDANYGSIQINLGLAYKFKFKQHLFSPGIQVTFNNNNFNLGDLIFDQEGNTSGIQSPSYQYLKINAGITWTYFKARNLIFHQGISMYNMNRAEIAILSNNTFSNKARINIHGEILVGSSKKTQFIPTYLISYHGNEKNILIGSEVKVPLMIRKYQLKAVHFTALNRISDALILEAGLNFKKIRIGLSYDVNISKLRQASHTIGGFEFSLRFIQLYPAKPSPFFRKCLDYM